MTAIALNRDVSGYWDYIKNASNQTKLALISLLSNSLMENESTEAIGVAKHAVWKAHRTNSINDELTEKEMHGEPISLVEDSDTSIEDIISGNSGKIAKSVEKWL